MSVMTRFTILSLFIEEFRMMTHLCLGVLTFLFPLDIGASGVHNAFPVEEI
jgi:hypothetical protein